MSAVRVLHVLPDFSIGGGQRMAVHLMRALDRRRFEVRTVSLYDPIGTDLEELLARSKVPVWNLGKRPGFDPRMFVRIDRALRRFRPHVTHTHLFAFGYALPPMLYRRVPAMVHTMHTLAEYEAEDRRQLWLRRLGFRCGVVPVAIAQEVASSITRVYGIEGPPLIHHGIPVEAYAHPRIDRQTWRRQEGFAPGDTLFVSVGRLYHPKNQALLLRSFVQSAAAYPHAHLLLVGRGEHEARLRKQVEALGLRDRVRFMGERTDIPEVLGAVDVFVLSSDWEGNPLTTMEAMAAGKPVISTAVGGVPELIEDDSCGLLVPRGDSEALARAISYLAANPKVRQAMGAAAAERAAERFDVGTMTRAYEELYETILARRSRFVRNGY